MATISCAYCGKTLTKGVKGSDNKAYCGAWHRSLGNPIQPIQGGAGAIVAGLALMFIWPGLAFRGTPLYLLLLIAGPIVLVFGLYVKFVMNTSSDQMVSSSNDQSTS